MTTATNSLKDYTLPFSGIAGAPDELEVSITGKCNLKCRYCFYAESMEKADDLDTQTWLHFFKEAGDAGVRKITVSGGECFMRKDFFELLDGIIHNKMRYAVLTNGALVNDKKINEFDKGKRRLRMDSIQFSIDGSCAEVHDKSRPPHSFDKAIENLRQMHAKKFPVTVRVTINRHNIDDLENIAELLLEDIGLNSFSTNEADVMGSARCNGQDIVLEPEEREQVCDIMEKLDKRYPNRINSASGPQVRQKLFHDIEEALNKGETSFGRGTMSACGGVFRKMAILHDGTMVPCNMLPNMVMGKIGTHRLQDVWKTHPCINIMRYRRQIPLTEIEFCSDCPYTGFCTGGCPASVQAKTGTLYAIDPTYCYRIYKGEKTYHEHSDAE